MLAAPDSVRVGVGCRRGAGLAQVASLVDRALQLAGACPLAVRELHTIDLKAEEPALAGLCDRRGWRLVAHPAQELAQVDGSVSSSEFVERVTGVDNVCERAALFGGGELVIPRLAEGGATAAVAVRSRPVRLVGDGA